jgi:hypothetical protein
MDLKLLPKSHDAKSIKPFDISRFTLSSPNVPACCRRTISFSCGWRHFPGVRGSSEAGAGANGAAGLGVEGRKREAIGVRETKASEVELRYKHMAEEGLRGLT